MPYPPPNAIYGVHPIGHPFNDMTTEQRIALVEAWKIAGEVHRDMEARRIAQRERDAREFLGL